MAKIKIEQLNSPEFQDQRVLDLPKKSTSETKQNKISMVFALWGIILSVIGAGVIFTIISVVMSAKYYFAKQITTSAKWAKYLSIVAILVNAVVTVIFNYFQA